MRKWSWPIGKKERGGLMWGGGGGGESLLQGERCIWCKYRLGCSGQQGGFCCG